MKVPHLHWPDSSFVTVTPSRPSFSIALFIWPKLPCCLTSWPFCFTDNFGNILHLSLSFYKYSLSNWSVKLQSIGAELLLCHKWVNVDFDVFIQKTCRSLCQSAVEQLNQYVTQLSHCWDQIPVTHKLKEVTAHWAHSFRGLSSRSAGSKAEASWLLSSGWLGSRAQRESTIEKVSRKQKQTPRSCLCDPPKHNQNISSCQLNPKHPLKLCLIP